MFEFARTKVCSVRQAPRGWEANPAFVYIGRPGPFGNPFRLERGAQRGSSLIAYRAYLRDRMTRDARFARAVADLHGKVLVCFCKPGPCHGDLLAWAADEMARRLPVEQAVARLEELAKPVEPAVLAELRQEMAQPLDWDEPDAAARFELAIEAQDELLNPGNWGRPESTEVAGLPTGF